MGFNKLVLASILGFILFAGCEKSLINEQKSADIEKVPKKKSAMKEKQETRSPDNHVELLEAEQILVYNDGWDCPDCPLAATNSCNCTIVRPGGDLSMASSKKDGGLSKEKAVERLKKRIDQGKGHRFFSNKPGYRRSRKLFGASFVEKHIEALRNPSTKFDHTQHSEGKVVFVFFPEDGHRFAAKVVLYEE